MDNLTEAEKQGEEAKREVCYEHGVELDENGICPVSGVKGRKQIKLDLD